MVGAWSRTAPRSPKTYATASSNASSPTGWP